MAAATAAAADKTWNGSAGTDFEADANWTGGTPADDLTTDVGVFAYGAPNSPLLTRTRSIKGLNLAGGYWNGENTAVFAGTPVYLLRLGSAGIVMDSTGSGNADVSTNANPELAVSQAWEVRKNILYVRGMISGAATNRLTKTGAGALFLSANNTYAGGTDVNAGILQADHPGALGNGPVSVGSNATLLANCTPFEKDITLLDGSTFGAPTWGDVRHVQNGTLAVTGTVTLTSGQGQFYIDSDIVGPGGLTISGQPAMGYQESMVLTASNSFAGAVSVGRYGWVTIAHPFAFGVGTNDIAVRASTDYAKLWIATGASGLSTSHSLTLGTNATLYVEGGVTLNNAVTLDGGTYSFYSGTGGNRYQTGPIVLTNGVTSMINANGSWSMGNWYQTGTISGTGGLKIWGSGTYSTLLYFQGSNTWSGTNTISDSNVRIAADSALGTGATILNPGSSVTLTANAVLPNEFRGHGNIVTGPNVMICTGSLSPGIDGIGTLTVEDLDFRGTYRWQFNETTSDLINATTLTFGSGSANLDVEWIGSGPAPNGDFLLMNYSGPDPVNALWTVKCHSSQIGKVRVDTANKQIVVKLASSGTLVFLK